jgi:nifR3 family TIM-barrel protein
MAEAVRKARDLRPDFIDINAGCPVKKVITRGAGSALMRKPELLKRIVADVVAVSDVPVTVKIRSGWDFDSINAVETARMCVDAGAACMVVHPRTRSQGFGGKADWTVIRAVKEAVGVPVVGSGDIMSPHDARRMMDETGADAVMIGRAALTDPTIFRAVAGFLGDGIEIPPSNAGERLDIALRQLDMLSAEVSERFAVLNMRKFFGWYSRGVRDGALFRQNVFRAESVDEIVAIVREFQRDAADTETAAHTHGMVACS